jgi:hypothetical protein
MEVIYCAFSRILVWLGGFSASFARAAEKENQDPGPGPTTAPADPGVMTMTDIHDIKPALDLGFDLKWIYFALAILALLALAALAVWLWKKRKKPVVSQPSAKPVPEDVEAYQMLDALATERHLNPKQFYFRLSLILRRYLERRYGIAAVEMTTEELLPKVDRLPLTLDLAQPLRDFCRAADPIKFAGVSPGPGRMAEDLAFVRNFVQKTTAAEPADTQKDASMPVFAPRPMAGSKPIALNSVDPSTPRQISR